MDVPIDWIAPFVQWFFWRQHAIHASLVRSRQAVLRKCAYFEESLGHVTPQTTVLRHVNACLDAFHDVDVVKTTGMRCICGP